MSWQFVLRAGSCLLVVCSLAGLGPNRSLARIHGLPGRRLRLQTVPVLLLMLLLRLLLSLVQTCVVSCIVPRHHEPLEGFVLDWRPRQQTVLVAACRASNVLRLGGASCFDLLEPMTACGGNATGTWFVPSCSAGSALPALASYPVSGSSDNAHQRPRIGDQET